METEMEMTQGRNKGRMGHSPGTVLGAGNSHGDLATGGNIGRTLDGLADVIGDFGPNFLDEARCREWLISRMHSAGYHCPYCGASVPGPTIPRYMKALRIRCSECRRQFTAWTATWMSGAKMDPREVFLVALMIRMGRGTGFIARVTGCSTTTVRDWRRRLRIYGQEAGLGGRS